MSSRTNLPAPQELNEILRLANIENDGNPIMLNFFRTDCPWCATFVPHLSEVYARHDFKLKIHEIGIVSGHNTLEMVEKFKKEKLIVFPIIVDSDDSFVQSFGIKRVPSIVVVNAEGEVERIYEGVTEQLTGILEQTLFAVANRTAPPEYEMIGNGCAP
jgi:thiol-disulfide isomerase/thioredoxin